MPKLSNRDKLEILSFNHRAIDDLQYLSQGFSVARATPSYIQEREKRLSTLRQFWGHSDISLEGIKTLLVGLKQNASADAQLTMAVTAIPFESRAKNRDIEYLREGRFLRIEIDLTAATIDELSDEIREYLKAYQPKSMQKRRKRKQHFSTCHIDKWDVYKRLKRGDTKYQIAKAAYRTKHGTTAGFGSNAPEISTVNRAIQAAERMIDCYPHPNY